MGVDVDPLSVFMSNVKTHPLRRSNLRGSLQALEVNLAALERSAPELESFKTSDLVEEVYQQQLEDHWVPNIPKLHHWFYRYALVDLARLLATINELDAPLTHREFFRLVFAGTIRGASRADPVPVSGVEVTKVMLEKEEAGRSVDVISLFRRRLDRAVQDMECYQQARVKGIMAQAYRGDVARLPDRLAPRVDAIITSPPYHGAVDYYRRHQLEMFWLGMTVTQDDRLELLERYLGRPKVPMRHTYVASAGLDLPRVKRVEEKMRRVSVDRANAFKHYAVGMSRAFEAMAARLHAGGKCVLVVGNSNWNGGSIDTSQLMADLAEPHFVLTERLFYPVKNRYMSYARHNGANIDREHVLVFERTRQET
jgi:hypothetical protein